MGMLAAHSERKPISLKQYQTGFHEIILYLTNKKKKLYQNDNNYHQVGNLSNV
jgi:hypothetical protein